MGALVAILALLLLGVLLLGATLASRRTGGFQGVRASIGETGDAGGADRREPARARRGPPSGAASPETIPLRCLQVRGVDWRVELECVRRAGTWEGRLIFVAPAGRAWRDSVSLRGESAASVIGQAVIQSDGALAERLSQLAS